MRFKLVALLMTLSLLISITGCDETINVPSDSESKITEAEANYEVIPVPEGGWTREELARTIRFNGVPIEYPFTVESLGDDFQLSGDGSMMTVEGVESLSTDLLYKGEVFASVVIRGEGAFEHSTIARELQIEKITVLDVDSNGIVTINGVAIKSTWEHIIVNWGEPNETNGDRTKERIWGGRYADENQEFMLAFTMNIHGNNLLDTITVILPS